MTVVPTPTSPVAPLVIADPTPKDLVTRLLTSENLENNNLINILGNIKPSKSNVSSLTSIIRGLCTKNGKLIGLLTNSLADITNNEDEHVIEIFKSFINDFILWLDNGGLILFEKYCQCLEDLSNPNVDTPEIDNIPNLKFEQFGKPILNCTNYINFIHLASKILRNPFVLDKLLKTRSSLENIIQNYHGFYKLRELNHIEFNNIKTFANGGQISNSSSPGNSNAEKVSSYFNLKQIMERSENEPFFLVDHKQLKSQIEFVLLDLNKPENDGSCNALAILSVTPSRSLMYPPFRVNELSITLENSCIILKPMVFSTAHSFNRSVHSPKLTISSPKQTIITHWYKKLLTIFPQENAETMLINANNQTSEMSGLGINIVTGTEHKKINVQTSEDEDRAFETPLHSSQSNTFNDLIVSPSLSSTSPLTQLQNQFRSPSKASTPTRAPTSRTSTPTRNVEPKIPAPQFARQNRQNSATLSLNSNSSFESARSHQVDRSNNIIHKTLTDTSLKLIGNTVEVFDPEKTRSRKSSVAELKSDTKKDIPPSLVRSYVSSQLVNVAAQFPTQPPSAQSRAETASSQYMSPGFYDEYSRPRSSRGELSFIGDTPERDSELDAINNDEIQLNADEDFNYTREIPAKPYGSVLGESKSAFASVPDLSSKEKPSLYQLSTGSGFDLQNFGKNHNPSFSIEKNMSDIIRGEPEKQMKNKSKAKSFFSIFKKGPKKVVASPHLPQSPNSSIENLNREDREFAAQVNEQFIQPPTQPPAYLTHPLSNAPAQPKAQVQSSSETPDQPSMRAPVQATSKTTAQATSKTPAQVTRNTPVQATSKTSVQATSKTPAHAPAQAAKPTAPAQTKKSVLQQTSHIKTDFSDLPSPADATPSPTTVTPSPTGSAFALPSSTSTYFFRPDTAAPTKETPLAIPQELKDIINDDLSVDFYLSNSTPKNIVVSKWKSNYGKWEMLTINERLFIKIVINYESNKSWLLVFKEEYDHEYKEDVDMPVLILDLDQEKSSIRQSTALDLQITACNSVTQEKALTLIRCKTGALSTEIFNTVNSVLKLLDTKPIFRSGSEQTNVANVTMASSIMDASERTSSTTPTSISSPVDKMHASAPSNYSLSTIEASNAQLINNPDNQKLLVLDQFPVRLQRLLPGATPLINEASSWKVLSMYSVTIYLILDSFTHKNYYNIVLTNTVMDSDAPDHSWLLADEEKLNRLERIGKAGLRIKVDQESCFMLECKGKKELKKLYETLV